MWTGGWRYCEGCYYGKGCEIITPRNLDNGNVNKNNVCRQEQYFAGNCLVDSQGRLAWVCETLGMA